MAVAKRIEAASCRKDRGRCGTFTLSALLVLVVLLAPGAGRVSVAWEARLDSAGVSVGDYWNAVAIDQAGDLVTAGVSLYPASSWDCAFVVAKVSRASGAVSWRQEFYDCGEDETWDTSGQEQVLIDAEGDVVVGRRDIGRRNFAVYKFSGTSGQLLWHQTLGRFSKHGPYAHAVSLDAAGNVVAVAGLANPNYWCHTDFVVTELDATTGATLWRHAVRGTFRARDECEDDAFNQAVAVAVDGVGDVMVTGLLLNARATRPDYPVDQRVVLKLSGSDGTEIWRRETSLRPLLGLDPDKHGERLQSSVTVDANGDVVTTWTSINPDSRRSLDVEKLSGADGSRLWQRSVKEPGANYFGLAVTVDFRADVAAAGIRQAAGGEADIVLLKLEGTSGGELWRQTIAGTAPGEGEWWIYGGNEPKGIATDAAGNVVLAGAIENAGSGVDFLVAAFAGESGDELWRHELDGAAHGRDAPRALAVDAGTVAVAGSLENHEGWLEYRETGADAVTVLLDAAGGREIWRTIGADRLPANDRATSVALDPAGDVVAGGWMQNETGALDFTVKKLSGATGAVLWDQRVSTVGWFDLVSVEVDPRGDIVAAGEDSEEAAVVKLAGRDGSEVWRHALPHQLFYGRGRNLAVTVTGDVVAGGHGRRGVSFDTVVKLSSSRGTELWRWIIESGRLDSLTLDPAGNVILVTKPERFSDPIIIKLNGTTGIEQWRATGPRFVNAFAVDRVGDVLTAGSVAVGTARAAGVVKLDGASGVKLWRTVLGEVETIDHVVAVEADGSGDLLVVRHIARDGAPPFELGLSKLAGATGELLWGHAIEHTLGAGCWSAPADVAIDATGHAFIAACAGSLSDDRSELSFAALTLDTADGGVGWYQEITSGSGSSPAGTAALVADAEGRVILAGTTTTAETGNDFTVVSWTACEAGSETPCDDGSVPGGGGCPEDCPVEEPSTTTTVTSTTTSSTTTTTTVPECIVHEGCDDGNGCTDDRCSGDGSSSCVHTPNTAPCDDGDPCTTVDRCVGGACVGRVVGVAGVACTLERLVTDPCGEGRLPRGLRNTISKRVQRSAGLLKRAAKAGKRAKVERLRLRAASQLGVIPKKTARAVKRRTVQRRISAACQAHIDGLVADCQQLIVGLEF